MIRYDNDCNGISKETLTSKKWQTCAACLIHVHSSAKDAITESDYSGLFNKAIDKWLNMHKLKFEVLSEKIKRNRTSSS